MPIPLGIVDDEPLWLDLLRVALSTGGLHVSAAYSSPDDALARWPGEVKVAILDVELGPGRMHGFALARELRARDPELGVVFLTSVVDPWMIDAAASSAVAGTSYLVKRGVSDVEQLCQVVRATAAGQVVVDPTVLEAIRGDGPVPGLSPLQTRIVRLMATGWSNAQIAEELGLAVKTVEGNITRISRIFNVDDDRNVRVGCVTRYLAAAVSGPHGVIAR